jgi:hypothetical protein
MACERNPNRIAALAGKAGMHRLAGKKLFYAGLAAGAAGLLAVLVGWTIPRLRVKAGADSARPAEAGPAGPGMVTPRQVPALPARATVTPAALTALSGKTCTGCHASPASKPGVWYIIQDDAYCQDCAPKAARAADVDLTTPSTSPPTAGAGLLASPGEARNRSAMQDILASADPAKVRLQEMAVDVKSADGWIRVQGGYFVYTPNGTGTGLAITPLVTRDDQENLITSKRQWNVTHLKSGLVMAGPYPSVEEARRLASILAQVDWRRDADALSRRELAATRQVVEAYNQALADSRTWFGR